jgi:2-desacetyl-2-hydroxyethyl bacteriochlorophyllide A dehydrogenase
VHPLVGEKGPHVQGHEFAGRVAECAPGVEGFPEGAVVAVEPLISDGTCTQCKRGDYNLCDDFGFIGLMGGGGGMSEYVVVPAERVHRMPDGIGTDTAALVEPLAVAWHALRRANLSVGDSALIIGGGPIGLCLLLAAKAWGAAFVAVSEVHAARRKAALELGADVVIDPTERSVVEAVREHVPGGVAASFETSGVGTAALGPLIAALAKGGTAVNVAQGRPGEIHPSLLMVTEVNLTGSLAYNGPDFPEVIAAVADGRLRPDALITARIPLEDAQQNGYEELLGGDGTHMKILIHP